MPVTAGANGERHEGSASRFELESILGSLEPLPGVSLDFDREIAEATAEEIRRKQNDQQAGVNSEQDQSHAFQGQAASPVGSTSRNIAR